MSTPSPSITCTIDGVRLSVPEGTLVIRAAETLGIAIPRFCDHPLLDPVGACRQCLVEVEGQPKPLAACTTEAADGMVVRTQLTSPLAGRAQRGNMELLLINHPLDCPMCDKGGECPLQNQAMSSGRGETRNAEAKRTFPKPIPLSGRLLLDRERCVQCARCTRFAAQIAGDPSLELLERGAAQQVGVAEGGSFDSYFSGNTVQICPVGALTSTSYRFGSRPFGLVSAPSVCEHCAAGCALRTDHRNGKVLRRLAGEDPEVNEEWNCDKGRWAFRYASLGDRLNHPRVRDGGEQPVASWPVALAAAGQGLSGVRGRAAVLTGGRLTLEDAYAYAKFARVALGTNDVDFRARPTPAEEGGFLEARVAGRGTGPTYADLERAPIVLLAGLETEEEAPIVFLRLRKAARRGTVIAAVGPYVTPGLARLGARLLRVRPGAEPYILADLAKVIHNPENQDCPASREEWDNGFGGDPLGPPADQVIHSSGNQDCLSLCGQRDNGIGGDPPAADFAPICELLRRPGAIILTGERLAAAPGALSAAARLADETGAALAWIPRRAGDRGALEAGAFPTLLPGGHPVTDPLARAEVAAVWNVRKLPPDPGRDTAEILRAAADGRIGALLIAGVHLDDLPDPDLALRAIERVPFVLSLELRRGPITDRADVVFPVSAMAEKQGTYVNWEGRARPFGAAVRGVRNLADLRVLHAIAAEMGHDLGLPNAEAARRELAELGTWNGARPTFEPVTPPPPAQPGEGEATLATWRMLLDGGRSLDGEKHLAEAAPRPVVRLCAATANEIGAADDTPVKVATERGAVTLPLVITDMPERVVWLPAYAGRPVHRELGVLEGASVRIKPGDA